ncbi:MAG: cysteine desulfurase [Peptococcaceae bacterium BRH_c4a]|nr:MAG: cysteine desulfurase [Peptococcaceae bacterium BRH_c4a]
MTVYLDYNATTPIHLDVLEEMISVYRHNYGNAGSNTHIYGKSARNAVEKARTRVASALGIEKNEVIFTSGATESNNLAILGLAKWGESVGRKHIISTTIEHKAVLEPLNYLAKKGFHIELVPVNKDCRVNPEDVINHIRPDTLMVSVMHANNETGTIQPVSEIGNALKDTPVYFHIDAAQTFGKLHPELDKLNYDLLSISGHKIHGPQGIGALIMKRKNYKRPPVQPVVFGGGQEGGLRPGTLPVALIVGLGKTAEVAQSNYNKNIENYHLIKEDIINQLQSVKYVINGARDHSLPNCINISFPGIDSEALMVATKEDIAISNGSACTSAEYTPSHVLSAMGLDDAIIQSSIRISWGFGINSINLNSLICFIKNNQ